MSTKTGRLVGWIRDAWLIVGITIAMFVTIEVGFTVAYWYRAGPGQGDDRRAAADTYQNADWPQDYYDELQGSDDGQWAPYVYWRRKPFQGRYINVDSQGIRATWGTAGDGGDDDVRPRVFFFGGSTIWGTGARDTYTIPSLFARELDSRGLEVRVTNFGESGYVSTQEVVLLIRELQRGNVPAMAVFLNGVNDVYSAFQQQDAGLPQNEFNRVRDFNSSTASVWRTIATSLSTTQFMKGVARRLSAGSAGSAVLTTADRRDLATRVLRIYQQNVAIVCALAEHYQFAAAFYWQPTIFGKNHLTRYEHSERDRRSDIQPLIAVINELLGQRDLARHTAIEFHDLSDFFADVTEPIFVDWVHLGESGNGYIAKRLVDDVGLRLMERRTREEVASANPHSQRVRRRPNGAPNQCVGKDD